MQADHDKPQAAILSASVGAGHDGAADELQRRLIEQGYDVTRVDYLDLMPGAIGTRLRDAYVQQLRSIPRSWEWLLRRLERSMFGLVCLLGGRVGAKALTRILHPDTEVVVSVYPLASQLIGGMRRRGVLKSPTVTYLTDMSVHRLWVARGIDTHIALHDVAAAQARNHGASDVVVCAAAVRPQFTTWTPLERADARRKFLVAPDVPVALVVAGSLAVGEIEKAARDIAASNVALPVVICANNDHLRERLDALGTVLTFGWIEDMAAMLQTADVVVQNAGGLTSLEAISCGVPVISYRALPGHGYRNSEALAEAGLAPLVHEPLELKGALQDAIDSRSLPALAGLSPEVVITKWHRAKVLAA